MEQAILWAHTCWESDTRTSSINIVQVYCSIVDFEQVQAHGA